MESNILKSTKELALDLDSRLNSFSKDDINKLDTICDKLNRNVSVYKDDNKQINEFISASYLFEMQLNREKIFQYSANKLMDDVSKEYIISKTILKNIKLKEKLDNYQNLK
tara:strand:- start:183 stop:515 length:333 start_codon:yes stop_codon:yes gene_type:complete